MSHDYQIIDYTTALTPPGVIHVQNCRTDGHRHCKHTPSTSTPSRLSTSSTRSSQEQREAALPSLSQPARRRKGKISNPTHWERGNCTW
eukprot:scaffold546_cov163-Amphora_coffeaeformis.AAC.9